MGFLFRAAAVVGLVYMLSPEREKAGTLPLSAASIERELGKAAQAAVAACAGDRACLAGAARLAAGAAAPRQGMAPDLPKRRPDPPERQPASR